MYITEKANFNLVSIRHQISRLAMLNAEYICPFFSALHWFFAIQQDLFRVGCVIRDQFSEVLEHKILLEKSTLVFKSVNHISDHGLECLLGVRDLNWRIRMCCQFPLRLFV